MEALIYYRLYSKREIRVTDDKTDEGEEEGKAERREKKLAFISNSCAFTGIKKVCNMNDVHSETYVFECL